MRRAVMVCLLVGLAAVAMGVDELGVVVLVEVIVAAMLELAERWLNRQG